jgi:hypothetical protein
MKSSITAGLDDEKKRIVVQEFIGSYALRERLIAVLNGKKASFRSETMSKTSYDKPGWPYLQADCNGYERAIDELISLLSSKKDEI